MILKKVHYVNRREALGYILKSFPGLFFGYKIEVFKIAHFAGVFSQKFVFFI